MVLNLKELVNKYNMNIKDIIHIGGHFGQEVSLYRSINPECVIDIFEPHPVTFSVMQRNLASYNNINAHNIALGPFKGETEMFVETANQGQSNSLLKPKIHTQQYPHIRFDSTLVVSVETLDAFNLSESYNFISIDVQGYELEVLKGAANTLKHVDYVIAEINNQELYENCCLVNQLDEFLLTYNLHRVETDWEGQTWGDGFYIRK